MTMKLFRWKPGDPRQSDPVPIGPEGRPMPHETEATHAAPDPLTDSGVHEIDPLAVREDCPHCFGTGHVMTKNDLLRQSLTLLGDDPGDHQALVAEFYRRLLFAAPGLATLFPPDLTDPLSSGEGKVQRDRLLGALLTVGQSYDPDHPDSEQMEILATHIEAWGRAHAQFARGDRVRPASVREYAAVFGLLMDTLHDALGNAWLPVFDDVWEEAYDHTARGMIAAAWTSGFKSPRYPRA
jgi:hemoglobin-like flavoprotein